MTFIPDDWAGIFQLDTAFLELFVRSSALYFGILALMRLMPRRAGGELATMDLVFVVLIAQAAAQALGDDSSISGALVVIVTFVAWGYLVNVLSYHLPFLERLTSAPPLQAIRDGKLLRRNMRREFLTEEELISHLREQGIDDVRNVKMAHIDGEGKITAVRKENVNCALICAVGSDLRVVTAVLLLFCRHLRTGPIFAV